MADAMNEVAWCYVEGFGCKKDKVHLLFLLFGNSAAEPSE
jgi:hypothetical protein